MNSTDWETTLSRLDYRIITHLVDITLAPIALGRGTFTDLSDDGETRVYALGPIDIPQDRWWNRALGQDYGIERDDASTFSLIGSMAFDVDEAALQFQPGKLVVKVRAKITRMRSDEDVQSGPFAEQLARGQEALDAAFQAGRGLSTDELRSFNAMVAAASTLEEFDGIVVRDFDVEELFAALGPDYCTSDTAEVQGWNFTDGVFIPHGASRSVTTEMLSEIFGMDDMGPR